MSSSTTCHPGACGSRGCRGKPGMTRFTDRHHPTTCHPAFMPGSVRGGLRGCRDEPGMIRLPYHGRQLGDDAGPIAGRRLPDELGGGVPGVVVALQQPAEIGGEG